MSRQHIAVSFEFFPPRNAEQELVLKSTWQKLALLNPRYLTVTFGAGGATQDVTHRTVTELIDFAGVPVAPHISCRIDSRETALDLLNSYRDMGVNRLVVLRGDPPKEGRSDSPFEFAAEMVAFVNQAFPGVFRIEVGCYPEQHPESPDMQSEIHYFEQKVDAGADEAITQYFFEADAYFRFVDQCRAAGIDIAITPGIMPITNYRQLARFSKRCGARIPPGLASRLESFGDDIASIRAYGLDVVSRLCESLLDGGAPGLHIYTLNRANATMKIWQRLHGGR